MSWALLPNSAKERTLTLKPRFHSQFRNKPLHTARQEALAAESDALEHP